MSDENVENEIFEQGKSTGPSLHFPASNTTLGTVTYANIAGLKMNPEIQHKMELLTQKFRELNGKAQETTEAIKAATPEDDLESLRGDIGVLDEDVQRLEGELAQLEVYMKMASRTALAALLLQLGAKPSNLTEITKILGKNMGGVDTELISMEELAQAADDAVTEFYRSKQL
jgi:predicted  nucleic acid-binding Zn-ribbon protein